MLIAVPGIKVAVLGSASASETSPEGREAYRIGERVASKGGVLLTGGCPGLPHAAVLGATSAGGLTVAVSPAMNREDHVSGFGYPHDSRVIVFTGAGRKGRNVILVRSSDACVFLGGGMGTLNEFTIAFDELGPSCAIGILTGTGGLSGELTRLVSLLEKSPDALLLEDSDPEHLVDLLFSHVLAWPSQVGSGP